MNKCTIIYQITKENNGFGGCIGRFFRKMFDLKVWSFGSGLGLIGEAIGMVCNGVDLVGIGNGILFLYDNFVEVIEYSLSTCIYKEKIMRILVQG
jgi:hypothetical protein